MKWWGAIDHQKSRRVTHNTKLYNSTQIWCQFSYANSKFGVCLWDNDEKRIWWHNNRAGLWADGISRSFPYSKKTVFVSIPHMIGTDLQVVALPFLEQGIPTCNRQLWGSSLAPFFYYGNMFTCREGLVKFISYKRSNRRHSILSHTISELRHGCFFGGFSQNYYI